MSKGYRIQASTGIHRGDRDYQQDQVCLLNHPRHGGCMLAVLADGMGGRSGGRKASDQVMLTARQLFERYDPDTDDASALLRQIVEESHLVIKLTAVSAEQEPHSTIAASARAWASSNATSRESASDAMSRRTARAAPAATASRRARSAPAGPALIAVTVVPSRSASRRANSSAARSA
eukprot:gene43158-57420_t